MFNRQPVIIGGGAAGLMTALCLAPQPVTLVCNGAFGQGTASGWAQGGIAAALGPDDSPHLHAADTMQAGAGLCDAATVTRITGAAPWAIAMLEQLGAVFAKDAHGAHELGLEAAHGRRRIVHRNDATGAEVMRVLTQAVRADPRITIIEHAAAGALLLRDGKIQGVEISTDHGPARLDAATIVLATGGLGSLFADTTNPKSATGSGLALAARAGANLRDMEFVQFHPTALATGRDPMPLISEALRGEGAMLTDETGNHFMAGADLAPRDVVARAVAGHLAAGHQVFLDGRTVDFATFPGIAAICRDDGIDPAGQLIPIRPAAHYHMGGIAVNAEGESSVPGLYAIGEAACTGLHGANRLASNSLLEALVGGRDAARSISGRVIGKAARGVLQFCGTSGFSRLREVREICRDHLGIRRSHDGMATAIGMLATYAGQDDAALVALLVAHAALHRRESRGAHFRDDYPATAPALAASQTFNLSSLSALGLAA